MQAKKYHSDAFELFLLGGGRNICGSIDIATHDSMFAISTGSVITISMRQKFNH